MNVAIDVPASSMRITSQRARCQSRKKQLCVAIVGESPVSRSAQLVHDTEVGEIEGELIKCNGNDTGWVDPRWDQYLRWLKLVKTRPAN